MPALEIQDLSVEYSSGGYAVRPIDGLRLRLEDGQLALLLGASGCGKTTLLSTLASILTPTTGTILLGGKPITGLRGKALNDFRRRGVGIVFQAFNLLPSLTAVQNVAVPMWASGQRNIDAHRRAVELLEQVGLGDRLHHRPANLSGGQAQRVAIARALALDPPLLLADEPTAHLDYIQVEAVLELLRRLASPGRVVVISTHDERLLPIADDVVEMTPRSAVEAGEVRVVLEPDEVLFRQGDAGDRVYVVEEGQVELRRALTDGGYEIVAVHGPGGYFGEIAPLFGLPRSATAIARGRAVLSGYGAADFRALRREQ